MKTEDGYIINKCLNGDHDAFGLLVDKYKAGVYALAYSRLHNFHDAQDLSQEAFIRAYEKLHTLKQWDSFIGWLYRITIRLCKKWLNENARRPDNEFIDDFLDFDNQDMKLYQDEQVFVSIREALSSLPEDHREVIMLHYFGGMTSSEISKFIGVSSSAIRWRLIRARSEIKEELIGTMADTFDKQKLQAIFTLRVLEITRHIKIQPMSHESLITRGSSILVTFTVLVLGICMNFVTVRNPHDTLSIPKLIGVAGIGDIPVYATDEPMIKSGGGAGLSNGNSISFSNPESNALSVLPSEIQNQWSKYPENPILVPGPKAWDSNRIDSPTILYDGRDYKMWYSGYDGQFWRICYATSPDGIMWEKHSKPVLDVDSKIIKEGVLYPTVVFNDSLYSMWYTSNWSIHYATSRDGIHWEKCSENPVLSRSIDEWDNQKTEDCTVIFKDGEYRMWYSGAKVEPINKGNIGYATSLDGIHWNKHPENPVLRTGKREEWDNFEVVSPNVLFNGANYEMWYIGFNEMRGINYRIGYATSEDGIHWEKCADNPIFDIGAGDEWDDFGVYNPFVMRDKSGYKMWYSGSNRATKSIGYASIQIPKRKTIVKNIDKAKAAPIKTPKMSDKTLLLTAFPNPANPEVWIPYQLSEDAEVTIRIYSASGQLVRTLELGYKSAGIYDSRSKSAYWDGRNEARELVKSGVYFYSIHTGKFTDTRKVVILR